MHKRFKLKKAFSMILGSYIAILLIPAALAVGFSVMANRMSTTRCIDDVSNNLYQGQILLEKQLETMDSSAMYLTYDYALSRMLQLQPLQPGDKNVWFVSQFSERLADIFTDTSVLYAYSVLLKNEYVFHTNGMTQGRNFFFESSRNYENMTAEEYIENSFSAVQRTLFVMDKIKLSNGSVTAITYNYPIVKGFANDGKADAVVQFLIPEETLKSFFFPLLQREGSQVLLLDGEGNQLAALSDYDTEEQRQAVFDASQLTDIVGSIEARLGDERSLLVYRRSEKDNLIIATVIPEVIVLEDARQLRKTSFFMMGICMLLELALGFYFAWKYSSPIKNLVQNVYLMINPNGAGAQETSDNKSEYEHLESGINQLLQTNRSMQMTLQEKQEKEKRDFLNYLFVGEFRENEDIIREGALVGVNLSGMLYCVVSYTVSVAVPADSATSAAMSLAEKVLKQGEERLRMSEWENVLAVCGGKEQISVLFGFPHEENVSGLLVTVREMLECLEKIAGSEVRAGIGRVYQEERDIHFSYMQSLYSVLTSKEMVTFYNSISQDFNALSYSTEIENKLVNSTKHGEIRQIQQIFDYIREENLRKRRLSNAMSRILISNIVATLIKVYNDVILNEELEQIVNQILRYPETEEALDFLEQQFICIAEESARSRDEREENYQKRLTEYVENNYSNPQLGVAMAAEEFTLSENYFSQFFKDVMKESFSNYLENLRLNKAKELIDEGKYNLEQVAGMVGYQNSGTFRRAFKRVTGISPSAWKSREE